MKPNNVKCLENLKDQIENNARKISFIRDFFSHSISEQEFFSKRGITGIHHILWGIEEELEDIIDEMSIIGRRIDGDSKES